MFWRRRRRLDEEVASHLAEETADNIERGMPPDAARHPAYTAAIDRGRYLSLGELLELTSAE